MTDVMHNFELFQPATLADAQAILGDHSDAWVLAGGMDSLLVPVEHAQCL